MTRRITDTYYGYDREAVVVTIPEGHEHAGTHTGELRARALDDETGEWFFELSYSTGIMENRIDVFPVAWVRRMELTDRDGLVNPGKVVALPSRDT